MGGFAYYIASTKRITDSDPVAEECEVKQRTPRMRLTKTKPGRDPEIKGCG
jgi:hypothetical protein